MGDGDQTDELAGARHNLAGAVGIFDLEKLHAADPQKGEEDDGHDNDADASDALQNGTLQKNARRQRVEAVEPVVVRPDTASKMACE
jgi:hypothetical protein